MRSETNDSWLADARDALDLVGEAGAEHLIRLDEDLGAEPVVVLIGAFNTGKSSLVKRLCGDHGVAVPAELVIDAKPTTATTYDVVIDDIRWRDTPGLDSGSVDHGRVADAAAAYADVVVLTLTPELFSPDDEAGKFARALAASGPPPKGAVHVVLTRADEQGGVRGGERFARWAAAKSAEASDLLASVGLPDVPVHVVAADVRGRNADGAVTAASYEVTREWDGIGDMLHAVRASATAKNMRDAAVRRATVFALERAIDRTRADLSVLDATHHKDDAAAAAARRTVEALKGFERQQRDTLREALRLAAISGPSRSANARFHLAYEAWSASAAEELEELAEQAGVDADPWSWEATLTLEDLELSDEATNTDGDSETVRLESLLRERAEKMAGSKEDAAKLEADLKAWEEAKRRNRVREHYKGKDGFSSLREKRDAQKRAQELRRRQQAFALFEAGLDLRRHEQAERQRREAAAQALQVERELAESQAVVLARKLFDGADVTGWKQHIIDIRVQLEERIAQLEAEDARPKRQHALDRLLAVRERLAERTAG